MYPRWVEKVRSIHSKAFRHRSLAKSMCTLMCTLMCTQCTQYREWYSNQWERTSWDEVLYGNNRASFNRVLLTGQKWVITVKIGVYTTSWVCAEIHTVCMHLCEVGDMNSVHVTLLSIPPCPDKHKYSPLSRWSWRSKESSILYTVVLINIESISGNCQSWSVTLKKYLEIQNERVK